MGLEFLNDQLYVTILCDQGACAGERLTLMSVHKHMTLDWRRCIVLLNYS